MTEVINIPIQRTGFPVKIGSTELWFDSSFENMKRFFNIDDIAKERLEEIREKAEHVHFPEEINEETIETVNVEDMDTAFDVNKEFIAIQYDLMFGEGTFKQLYADIPDIIALEKVLDIVGKSVADKINEQEAERVQQYSSKRAAILDKKKQKQK
ncbi:hypothetical protein [Alkalibacterium thalassium]|uniref:Uncharacterized protein n=1 Tax=Alkalibacterium thalassium TaxID=426701 RepID=A0A1G8VR53_9LACT|nr:hypothetical protein [Alkalibacterium thalassium]SDJ67875.1 hypothetical protein SAMN04488098_100250 [Alkalibacterium thalassium]